MSSKYILLILISIFLLYSCYKSTEWEDVTADYDPVLNVIGIISLDENIESFVGVYRTTELTDTSMYFSAIDSTYEEGKWYVENLYEPALFIDSAIVIISTDTDTDTFDFDLQDRKYKNNQFLPQPDFIYNLRIEVNGFDPVIGELTTPLIPNLDPYLIDDTLSASSTYTIKWGNNPIIAKNGLLTGELINPYIWCGGEFYSTIEFDQEEFTVFPQWCNPEEVGIGDIDNDYGIISESQCICDNYRIWDQDNETCICTDGNPPVLENDEEASEVFGGCESAVNEYGCIHTFDDETFLYEDCPVTCGGCEFIAGISETSCEEGLSIYCPETCDECSPDDVLPLENRNWDRLDLNNYLESEINSVQTDYGFCGDGNQDYEELLIRIMAMDDNYYQYFGQEKYKEFSNFLFETGGTEGQSIGIEGGFGVFGAFASDTLTRVLSP